MTTPKPIYYDLPPGSGRRFLFGLFGRDHDVGSCEKDGCADCAIITHYENDIAKARNEEREACAMECWYKPRDEMTTNERRVADKINDAIRARKDGGK